MRSVIAYTDGCCLGNPGTGGWGSVMQYDGATKEFFGGEKDTTNNRMEMMAVIQTLESFLEPAQVQIHTDSQYVKNGMTSWLTKWKANGWRTADKKPVKNKDLWERLDALCRTHQVSFHWVRGHNGHPENERADALANLGAQAYA
jgi:ribonuclease HI